MTYGCHNKPRPTVDSKYIAQEGWSSTFYNAIYDSPDRTPLYAEVKSAFGTTSCQYFDSGRDPSCIGCAHIRKMK